MVGHLYQAPMNTFSNLLVTAIDIVYILQCKTLYKVAQYLTGLKIIMIQYT